MTKIRFYIDICEGLILDQQPLTACTSPGKKYEGHKRVAFDVIIPHEVIFNIDAHSPEVSKIEVIDKD